VGSSEEEEEEEEEEDNHSIPIYLGARVFFNSQLY
jgi:hypothetical protein